LHEGRLEDQAGFETQQLDDRYRLGAQGALTKQSSSPLLAEWIQCLITTPTLLSFVFSSKLGTVLNKKL
jgi:hypothetical protein